MKILIIGLEGAQGWQKSNETNSFAFVDAFGEFNDGDDAIHKWVKDKCAIFSGISGAVNAFNPDLASINVPNFAKNDMDMELFFIEKRIPLLISKLRLREKHDFYRLLAAAEENSSAIYIGEFYRYIPCVLTAKALIDGGRIGIPEQMRYDCGLPDGTISPWENKYKHLSLEDLAFHHFSVIHYLLDITADTVYGDSYTPKKGGGVKGTVSSTLIVTKSGCHISHGIDWHNTMRNTGFLGNFFIDGTKGGLSVENGRVYTMGWGSEKCEVPVVSVLESTAPEKLLSGKPGEIWTIQEFKPVIDCIYAAIGESL
jgi:hypothetical protein